MWALEAYASRRPRITRTLSLDGRIRHLGGWRGGAMSWSVLGAVYGSATGAVTEPVMVWLQRQ
jgi:hypothetical protein